MHQQHVSLDSSLVEDNAETKCSWQGQTPDDPIGKSRNLLSLEDVPFSVGTKRNNPQVNTIEESSQVKVSSTFENPP